MNFKCKEILSNNCEFFLIYQKNNLHFYHKKWIKKIEFCDYHFDSNKSTRKSLVVIFFLEDVVKSKGLCEIPRGGMNWHFYNFNFSSQ